MIHEDTITNPNGANGSLSDPREQSCWDFYVEGLLKGQPNAYAAAKKAGYSETSAKSITMRDWFKERLRSLRRKEMLEKSERNLDRYLDLKEEDELGKVDKDIIKIKTDISKTIVKTLGKDLGYSERAELTGKDGKDLILGEDQIKTLIEKIKNE